MNALDRFRCSTVAIQKMPPISMVVIVPRRVKFRLWLFRCLIALAAHAYPGSCPVTYNATDDEKGKQ